MPFTSCTSHLASCPHFFNIPQLPFSFYNFPLPSFEPISPNTPNTPFSYSQQPWSPLDWRLCCRGGSHLLKFGFFHSLHKGWSLSQLFGSVSFICIAHVRLARHPYFKVCSFLLLFMFFSLQKTRSRRRIIVPEVSR